ncbi:golgin subfamily A member 1 isoform X2 [Teleopsis dalmanni]|uniref:golgin subfamily A member 1 isoform X2 n=1 Tax=Teleopsis dalmanni TaxID=139649 RepID=UPI0018CDA9C3|nr:golgin subfamily A member 1 isoform X2 [Teleopsis dalmanni]
MFSTLKNKIMEETGSTIATQRPLNHTNNNRTRSRFASNASINSTNDDALFVGSNSEQLSSLRSQCNDLTTKVADLMTQLQSTSEEKSRVEKTNEILLETVKVAQTQKDLYCDEQEKIHNLQQCEIEKLKNLLSFKEQEAMDRLAALRQFQQQVQDLTTELEQYKKYEPIVANLQDELEQLRHSSEIGKNNMTTTLAAVEEENHHLKMRLRIVEQSRVDTLTNLTPDEKIKALIHERKLLEQHLEEAQLQLSDIKSSWSGQNLALETQVNRLSKQVAEETTEKRKALKACDDLMEKIKKLDFEMIKFNDELEQRNNKIKLLEEEIDELNLALNECRDKKENEILFERNKSETLQSEINDLKLRVTTADERFSEYTTNSELIAQTLRQQNTELQDKLSEAVKNLETERSEKSIALENNAENIRNADDLARQFKVKSDETHQLEQNVFDLQNDIKTKDVEISNYKLSINEFENTIRTNEEKLNNFEEMQREVNEKNKSIKILNQRLADIKKTVQKEFRHSKSFDIDNKEEKTAAENVHTITNTCTCHPNALSNGVIIMDEVNFKYLKHVIVKFLTSREVEAKHLIRAVATLLKLSAEEEKLLHDTINWKMSWFGVKPNHGSGQRAFSIPPS